MNPCHANQGAGTQSVYEAIHMGRVESDQENPLGRLIVTHNSG